MQCRSSWKPREGEETFITSAIRLKLAAVCLLLLPPLVATSEESVSETADEKIYQGSIVEVGQSFGNLETDIPTQRLNLELGNTFSFSCKGRSFRAVFSNFYSDVPRGTWLGLQNMSGQLQLAINYGDANEVSECGVGDAVSVRTGSADLE